MVFVFLLLDPMDEIHLPLLLLLEVLIQHTEVFIVLPKFPLEHINLFLKRIDLALIFLPLLR